MPPQTRSSKSNKRVTRSTARQKVENVSASQATLYSQTSSPSKAKNEEDKQPPRKRTRRGISDPEPEPEPAPVTAPSKRVRGKQGKLQALMNMPVDIFAEIAVYLHPVDLVYLARVNKFFRELLMSRSFIHVWRCAEGNVKGLPPCPKELCEPQYAALLRAASKHSVQWIPYSKFDFVPPVVMITHPTPCFVFRVVDIFKVTDASLVFSSRGFVPGRRVWRQSWCLFDDARAVKDKLNALEGEGNQEEREKWIKERRAIVTARVTSAQPLVKFLKNIEKEHDAEISAIRGRREAEIKSRLLELGCNEADFVTWRQEWKSMTLTTKALTERAWEAVLPSLLAYTERNREQRLESEKRQRRWQRQSTIHARMDSLRQNSDVFARALSIDSSGRVNPNEIPCTVPGSTYTGIFSVPTAASNNMRILKPAIPGRHQMINWPVFATMLDTEMSLEELEQTLQKSEATINQVVSEWIDRVEQILVNLLPEESMASENGPNSSSTNDTAIQPSSSIPEHVYTFGGGSELCPLTTLSLEMQRLLRADSVFMNGSSLLFYPDDIWGSYLLGEHPTYEPSTVKIAKALLALLGLPDALYLRLKAAGRVFVCGRCSSSRRMTWREIIQHYVGEQTRYTAVRKSRPRARAAPSPQIFAHDIDTVEPDRPLLSVVSAEEQPI
ncbi:hypothetical protein FRC07_003392 [Ceratobasidium sp. 392]|nr:hypothetical protein FRC07_003392 [Ceratobasidium sp. 392]